LDQRVRRFKRAGGVRGRANDRERLEARQAQVATLPGKADNEAGVDEIVQVVEVDNKPDRAHIYRQEHAMTRARNTQIEARSDARALARSKAARLVERVAKEAELSNAAAAAALDAILQGVDKSLKKGDKVHLVGFGAFSMREGAGGKAHGPVAGKRTKASLAELKHPGMRFKGPASKFVSDVRAGVKKGDEVRLVGFGTFSVRERTTGEDSGSPALRETKISASAFEPDARARALLRGVEIVQDDLRNTGGAYDLEEVRTLMRGVSRQRIDRRVREGTLLAVPGPSNRRRYPTVQFNSDGAVIEGLKEVRDALPTKNPWSVLNFLVTPESKLDGRKPIDLLRAGEIEIVIEAARRMGQQGA
jgi:nucleoid DNA-binding protein